MMLCDKCGKEEHVPVVEEIDGETISWDEAHDCKPDAAWETGSKAYEEMVDAKQHERPKTVIARHIREYTKSITERVNLHDGIAVKYAEALNRIDDLESAARKHKDQEAEALKTVGAAVKSIALKNERITILETAARAVVDEANGNYTNRLAKTIITLAAVLEKGNPK